ncbi:LOW QUALITY PROTEIN: hypothetical protein ACHAXA_010371 [Cyclostephanos tholiformis]|uniref:Uncharacterized protein n=1 Tax=Cyclostephanos tholiformis TaxID=382380 RepID=A0ABD3RV23_9STRA
MRSTFWLFLIVELDMSKFSEAMRIYESLRVDRVCGVLTRALPSMQKRRAESKLYNAWREASINAQVWAMETRRSPKEST